MRRPTSDPLPPLAVPDGVEVRGYRPEDADAVLAVNAAAFAHHPEQGSLDAAGLAERDLAWQVAEGPELETFVGEAQVLTDDFAPVDQLLTPYG